MRCTVRKILRRPTIQYVTVGQDEVGLFNHWIRLISLLDTQYLVEVPKAALKEVPVAWSRVSSCVNEHR